VQFVPFKKYNNSVALAEAVLKEVPKQFCEYMRKVNKVPGTPK